MHEWQEVLTAVGSVDKTAAYQNTLMQATESFFPLKTTIRRSSDLPWFNKATLKLIENRKRLLYQKAAREPRSGKMRRNEWMGS